jgi:flagellar hook-basal body complex protein FliE
MQIHNNIVFPYKGETEAKISNEKKNSSFDVTLQNALQEVNKLQLAAEQANLQLLTGQVEDLHQVVLAGEKAALALQMTLQVRNKLMEAYQEMMRMQV